MAALVFLFGQGTAFAQEAEEVQKHADVVWTIVSAALVFFMQAGFAMVETGFTRAKNAANIMMKNLMDFCMGCCAFWFIGFGLMFGKSDGFFGTELVCFRLAAGPRGRGLAFYLLCLSAGVCRHCRHHCFRSDGRAHQVLGLLDLLARYLRASSTPSPGGGPGTACSATTTAAQLAGWKIWATLISLDRGWCIW
jgi:hypothetical protein